MIFVRQVWFGIKFGLLAIAVFVSIEFYSTYTESLILMILPGVCLILTSL